MPRPRKPTEFDLPPALLRWWRVHGRHDLPWHRRRTPYRVWISEVMLQQTQVAAVIPYYRRFLARFPNVRTLAAASLDDVLGLWSGLGYYARARNLWRAARVIRADHAGRFPRAFEQVAALPGIGRSTAGAILALARDERHAILDGNVKRVLARYHAVKGWPGDTLVANRLWRFAEQHTPYIRIANYTQAIMDLGATLCTRTRPRCDVCPLARACRAHALGRETAFPAARPRKAKPLKRTRMLLVVHAGQVLLERRPPTGIWGGLWSLPEVSLRTDAEEWCRRELGVAPHARQRWPVVHHGFSHYALDIFPMYLEVFAVAHLGDRGDRRWAELARVSALGLPAPTRKLLNRLGGLRQEPRRDPHVQARLAG
ncbi:MAG: A/G-specific adenine glycosylase [Gammaproteobacteria bacterium]